MNKHILLCLLITTAMSCNANHNGDKLNGIDRQPVVAGSFYSADKTELYNNLKSYFSMVSDKSTDENLKAVIVPHAGYVYSAEVAANGYAKINPSVHYNNVFILASSHRAYFEGASIYNLGDYYTPLGKVKVNKTITDQLLKDNKVFSYVPEAHFQEHSIEVQLPFLQYIFKDGFQIVPIVLGTNRIDRVKEIAEGLKSYFNENNLFIISSDFSHYPSGKDAEVVDIETMKSIISNSPENFLKTIDLHEKENISNLSTSACGWTSILTLLYLTQHNDKYLYQHIIYKNSGEYLNKNSSRVVGYNAIMVSTTDSKEKQSTNEAVEKNDSEFSFSLENQKKLLSIARKTIDNFLENGEIQNLNDNEMPDELKVKSGAFVTLHKNGELRGCIGRFTADEPLYKTVQRMAVSSATEDYRFSKVSPGEMKNIDIEISVLSPLKKIDSIDEIVLGKHGIYLVSGYSRGTFLPQVATETGWDKEEFLGHCARDKARIGWYGWKDADIYTYEAFVFGEKEMKK